VQFSAKWWTYPIGTAIIIGFHLVRHLRKGFRVKPDEEGGPLSFGSLVGDTYSFRRGVFSLKSPDGTVAIEDGPSGVLFSDIAGGFTMVGCHRIPRAQMESLDAMGPKRFIEVFVEEVLVPRRISPAFGMPLLGEGHLPAGCESATYYVDGTIRGGSSFAKFLPDGSSERLDLRLGLLATIRDDRVFVFLRGITPDLPCVGADGLEGIEEHLMAIMRSTRLPEKFAASHV
jgi:hypothetical protein